MRILIAVALAVGLLLVAAPVDATPPVCLEKEYQVAGATVHVGVTCGPDVVVCIPETKCVGAGE